MEVEAQATGVLLGVRSCGVRFWSLSDEHRGGYGDSLAAGRAGRWRGGGDVAVAGGTTQWMSGWALLYAK